MSANTVIVLLALTAALLPLAISYEVSRRQSLAHQEQELLLMASDLLRRSEETGNQLWVARESLKTDRYGTAGSEAEIRHMRYLALTSTYLQAVGRMVGTKVICSSMGSVIPPEDLGAPDIVTINGVRMWLDTQPKFGGGAKFHAIESENCVVFIAPELLLDVYGERPGVSLGILTGTAKRVIKKKGVIDPSWLDQLKGAKTASFRKGDLQIALRRSEEVDIVAVAAQPIQESQTDLGAALWLNLSIGALIGLAAAALILRRGRSFQAFPFIVRAGLRHREFFLEYQPIVDLESGAWIGAEALIRWRRPTGETLRPDLFIKAAEDAKIVQEITAFVVETALTDLARLNAAWPSFCVGINASAADFHSGRLAVLIFGAARRHNAVLENLGVEVTESGLLAEEEAATTLKDLKEAGVRVLLDDFGTGYSSLAYLMRLDVEVLKIDRLFVAAIGTESVTSNVVSHMIQMAKDLKMDIIAEGVETEEQAQYLLNSGVTKVQGFLFAKSMSIDDLIAELQLMQRSSD